MKRQSLTPAVFVIVLAAGGLPAAAQSTNTNNAAPVEVTPYAARIAARSCSVSAIGSTLSPNERPDDYWSLIRRQQHLGRGRIATMVN